MKPGNMTVVNFDPPLERKDFESVLTKVQDMFPDWEWCANTGTPTVRDREKILPGIMKNQNISGYGAPIYTEKIGSLIHYGRFKHYGEADCLGYSSNWSRADTNHYIKQGYDVEVIDGWAIDKHNITLDTDSMFKDLNESIKRIIRESIDEFDWVRDLGEVDLSGWYVTKPSRKLTSGLQLVGNLYYIDFDKGSDKVQAWVNPFGFNAVSEEGFMYDYIRLAKHEVKHLENKMDTDSETPYGDGPYNWAVGDVLNFLEDGYFIKLF